MKVTIGRKELEQMLESMKEAQKENPEAEVRFEIETQACLIVGTVK